MDFVGKLYITLNCFELGNDWTEPNLQFLFSNQTKPNFCAYDLVQWWSELNCEDQL